MKNNYKPDFTYADFASQFTAEFYNPDDWADLLKGRKLQLQLRVGKFFSIV